MKTSAILSAVSRIVAEQSGIDAAKIKSESNLVSDLGMDSLDIVETVMAIEEEFSFEITDAESERLAMVSDIVTIVEQKGGVA